MKKILIPLAAAILAGCACNDCWKRGDPKDPVIGNWGLELGYDAMKAGHMIASRDANGNPQALVLWRWASPIPMKDFKIEGNKFSFVHPWGDKKVEGSVCCGTLKATMFKKDGSIETSIKGWRNPPIASASIAARPASVRW